MPVDQKLPEIKAGLRPGSGKFVATCNARTRNAGYCNHTAGWGTDHLGEGRCKFHGGARFPGSHLGRGAAQPSRIRELQQKFIDDPKTMQIRQYLALMRSVLEDYMELAEQSRTVEAPACNLERVIKGTEKPEPEDFPKLARCARLGLAFCATVPHEKLLYMTAEITKAIKRLHEIEEGLKLRIEFSEFTRLLSQVAEILESEDLAPDVLARIAGKLERLDGQVTGAGTQV